MEQIYYTQCPVGYGLGASNGFQIKRLSAGYPASGDFRALGMRAFLPGTRVLAPSVLRYRRDGEVAEIAWLTPRPQEYQTERGTWGRPGGHFAHGVRLDRSELAAQGNWPAGLFDDAGWRRSDPEPTRGRPPDPVEFFGRAAPTFSAVSPRARGEDRDVLARLLTALALAVREGRTLFLIDEPERLAGRVAVLTFAFPTAMRPALTFSTYHDRPEELPGFRLQGTTPSARPNRAALASSGVVADLVAGTFEPVIEPSPWSTTIAGWLLRGGAEDDRAWTETEARASKVRPPKAPEAIWSDAWLDRLVGFHDAVQPSAAAPLDDEGWSILADLADWSGRVGLASEWVRARPLTWWSGLAGSSSLAEARRAFVARTRLPESWSGVEGATVGEAASRWLAGAGEAERVESVSALLTAAPAAKRPAFLGACLRGLPAATLVRLKEAGTVDPGMLLPLEVRAAVAPALARGQDGPLREALNLALRRPAVLVDALDALAAEVADRPGACEALGPVLADAFEQADGLGRGEPLAWALRRPDAVAWIGPFLRRLFGPPHGPDAWAKLRDRAPAAARPSLARAVLDVAAEPKQGDAAFRWGVEGLLLTMAEADRPHDPTWPECYLERTPSGLDLVGKLYARDHRNVDLRRWLKRAKERGEISAKQLGRIEQAQSYARALASGDAQELLGVRLPDVPPADRGALLGQILGHVGGAAFERLDLCLESCRLAWPGAFEAGAAGLDGLARPLAQVLVPYRGDPGLWIEHLRRMLDRLGIGATKGGGFEPDSLAAEIVAETTRAPAPPAEAWRLRRVILQRGELWRILAVDARRDGMSGPWATTTLERWDRSLEKPGQVSRFFELMLNACDGAALAACVSARASDLRSLGRLPWWSSSRTPGAADDLREGFARLAPMAPLADEAIHPVRLWMQAALRGSPAPMVYVDGGGPDLLPLDDDPESAASPTLHPGPEAPRLSPLAQWRWLCLEGLSSFARPGLDASRWPVVQGWIAARLPLDRLEAEDRYRFVAQVLARIEPLDGGRVAQLARWLARAGLTDADRLGSWADDLVEGVDRDVLRVDRLAVVGDLRAELKAALSELKPCV